MNQEIHGIGIILKKLLWIEEREMNLDIHEIDIILKSFMRRKEKTFGHAFVKNIFQNRLARVQL